MTGPFAIDGFSYPSWWNGNYAAAESGASLDELKATGANWVSIVPTQYTTSIHTADIHPTERTESDLNVAQAIDDAHSRGLSVMLKPHVDPLDYNWRGTFAPDDANAWFQSYKAMMLDYAKLAASTHAEMLCIGCEYESLTGAAYRSQWVDVIDAVRAVYKGPIVYAAESPEAKDVSFWDKVDYIGIDAYSPLTTSNNPTVAEMAAGWTRVPSNPWYAERYDNKSPVDFFHELATTYGKPVVFTEIGYKSTDGANTQPGNSGLSGPVDLQEQADAYQAFFQAWSAQKGDWMKGAFLWDWNPMLHPQNQSYIGWGDYTPQDKPAEAIITSWYGGSNAAPPPASVGADTLVLHLSEDAWQGDAQFALSIDGQQVIAARSVTASHAAGASEDVALTGNWGPGQHQVVVTFLNDGWGGNAESDRNLYLHGLEFDGRHYPADIGLFNGGASATVTVQSPSADSAPTPVPSTPVPAPTPAPAPLPALVKSTINLHVSDDHYQGSAQFQVFVDGKQLGGTYSATALHTKGAWQDIKVTNNFDPTVAHDIEVRFVNDAHDSTGKLDGHDRNLYVGYVELNGHRMPGENATNTAAGGFEDLDPHAAVMTVNGSVTFHAPADYWHA